MTHREILNLFLLTLICNLSHQQQNLCGTDGRRILVADPSSCHRYLECRWDFSSNPPRLRSVHQNDCRNFGSNHFQTSTDGSTGICVNENPICSDPLGLCPAGTAFDIMIANSDDRFCRQYRPCRQPDFPYMSCRTPLVFNRNSGSCDFADFAPCLTFAECPPIWTGQFPGNRCYTFIFCFEGEQMGDEFECPMGWMFDESINDCSQDVNGICRRSNIEGIDAVRPISSRNFLGFVKINQK